MDQTKVTVETPTINPVDDLKFHVTLARIETKMDLVLGTHGQQLNDHEHRIRAQEEKKTVSPSQLLASAATSVALMGGTVTILDRMLK